ncbi:nitrogen fixation protein NifR [Staphylococcus aureus]|nr:nitrogen fixation protein NifR [Staphylococcus aureus]
MRNKNISLEAFHVANKMHILGPQQREFRKEILQAMQVGVWAPTQKLTKSQPTIMCKLGWDDEINIAKISFLSHSQ